MEFKTIGEIFAIGKSAGEQVKGILTERGKQRFLDIRVYYLSDSTTGKEDWRPTKRGVCIPAHLLDEFSAGIQEAVKVNDELGTGYGPTREGDNEQRPAI